jgi:hypothetical protein
MSTTTAGTCQISGGTSSTQTNGDNQDINNPPPPANPLPPPQVNQSEGNLDQIEVQDWDKAEEDEAKAEENELIMVQ